MLEKIYIAQEFINLVFVDFLQRYFHLSSHNFYDSVYSVGILRIFF